MQLEFEEDVFDRCNGGDRRLTAEKVKMPGQPIRKHQCQVFR